MTDYFALLLQPRRPWLNPNELKEKYRELARVSHPDQSSSENQDEFASINEAYRVLVDPKLRIQHLLTLAGAPPSSSSEHIPEELADLFMEIAPVLNKIDMKDANQFTKLIERVQQQLDRALEEVRQLDTNWNAMLGPLEKLYQRISYLTHWQTLLEERRFQLSI